MPRRHDGRGGTGGSAGAAAGSGGAAARRRRPGAQRRRGRNARAGWTGGRVQPAPRGTGGAPPPLKKFVGNITTRGQVRSDFITYWDQISPENAGKWGSVERTRDQMNWSTLDTMYKYTKENNILFKQHKFVWGSQQPAGSAACRRPSRRAEVEEWIRCSASAIPTRS